MKHIQAKIDILDNGEEQMIHDATVRLLSEIGLRIEEPEILDRFADAGASVDRTTMVAKIPETMLMLALEQIQARFPSEQPGGASHSLTITVTPQPFIVDYPGKERRYGTLDDLIRGIVVENTLVHLKHASPIITPSDVPASLSDLFSYQALFTYARIPGDAYINSQSSAAYVIEMAELVHRKATYLVEPVSPLRFTSEHLQLANYFAKKGQRLAIGPMVIAGLSGPVTLAGTLVIQNAEILASLVLVNLLGADCVYRYAGGAHTMDLRTTLCSFGSPNQVKLVLAERQMARRYGLPCLGSLGLTDALPTDFQMGFEKGLSAGIASIAGVKWIGNQGHIGADQAASLEQMVIDDEWVAALNYILQGFEISVETIGWDVIRSVGIGGSFIAEEHTAHHSRENYWKSDIFSRLPWDAWESEGRQTIYDRAHTKIVKILTRGYPPEPLISTEIQKEIQKIVESAIRAIDFMEVKR